MLHLLQLFALIILSINFQSVIIVAHRLNVPHVLLPYHPKLPTSFILEITDPLAGGCFQWRSTRPSIVSITPILPQSNSGCSNRVLISAISKHDNKQTADIFAEDEAAGVMLRCDVTVDVIKSISIETTANVLFLDAAPAEIVVCAHDDEGNKFSSLDQIPFEWTIDVGKSDAARPLKNLPFAQSKYEAPPGVDVLEKNGQRGYVILVEGLMTGSAKLTAKLAEHQFQHVAAQSVELLVIATLLLHPSEDIYIPVHSIVKYRVEMLKHRATEVIQLPSKHYYLQLDENSVCVLDVDKSEVTALEEGRTKITLHDRNVLKSKHGLQPIMAHISVTYPGTVRFFLHPNNIWVLEVGRNYRIDVQLYDVDGNRMFITDNARFDTQFDNTDLIDVIEKSNNGTYLMVKAVAKGKLTITSTFSAIIDSKNNERRFDATISGDQLLQINDAISIVPSSIAFPYVDNIHYQYQFQAIGGSGTFRWLSNQSSVANIVETNGIVRSGRIGEATITTIDIHNHLHSSTAKVYVVIPTRLAFGESRVEAKIGDILVLYIALFGRNLANNTEIPIYDCRQSTIKVTIDNMNLFRHEKNREPTLFANIGCSSIVLTAQQSGDTKVRISIDNLSAVIQISSFPPLQVHSSLQPLVLYSSSHVVRFDGGPRPWILDQSKYFTKLEPADKKVQLDIERMQDTFRVICTNRDMDTNLLLYVGNRKSTSNPLPIISVEKIRLCCSSLERLTISIERLPSTIVLPPCPSSSQSIYFDEESRLAVFGFGKCGDGSSSSSSDDQQFDSIDSLNVDWKSDNTNLLQINAIPSNESSKLIAVVKPKAKTGLVRVHATMSKSSRDAKLAISSSALPLNAEIGLNLVDLAQLQPASLLFFDHRQSTAVVKIIAGSGHFYTAETDDDIVSIKLHKTTIEVSPKRIGKRSVYIHDLCIGDRKNVLPITVADIDRILVNGPHFVQENEDIVLHISVVDQDGAEFSSASIDLMQLHTVSMGSVASVQRVDSRTYRIHGIAAGNCDFVVISNLTNGRMFRSVAHHIHIFAVLSMLPKHIVLIPESVFQLEITGGPQVTDSAVAFSFNNSGIVTVSPNGLIESVRVGYVSVIGKIGSTKEKGAIMTQDTVTVRVTSLTGVRIRVASTKINSGTEFWARVDGIADDETPFAFGGARYPLNFDWSIGDDTEAIQFSSVFSESYKESSLNRHAIMLRAERKGFVTLKVIVSVHEQSKHHFSSSTRTFSDQVSIVVDESICLVEPSICTRSILMTVNAQLALNANRASESIDYAIVNGNQSNIISIQKRNILHSGNTIGIAAIAVRATDSLSLIGVEIAPIGYIQLVSSSNIVTSNSSVLSHLPIGCVITLNVIFRDRHGRRFDAANTVLDYRPHRFDLTEIRASTDKRTFDIHLLQAGETVFQVWDRSDRQISTFVRLSVADVRPIIVDIVHPIERRDIVGDIINFIDHYQSLIVSLIITCAILLFISHGYAWLSRYGPGTAIIQKLIGYSTNAADRRSGAFASDTPLSSDSFVRWRTSVPQKSSPIVNRSPTATNTGQQPYLWSLNDSQTSPSSVRQLINRSK